MISPESIQSGDDLRKAKQYAAAIEAYREAIKAVEVPDGEICMKIARCHEALGDKAQAVAWTLRVVDSGEAFVHWQGAASLLDRLLKHAAPANVKRRAKVWLCGSYTTVQLAPLLRLAALREGMLLDVKEGDFGQYRQETIDPKSRLYAFEPNFVVMAVHHGEVALPEFTATPHAAIDGELARWTSLWQTLKSRSKARLVMHNFAAPLQNAFGNLAARLSGSRAAMIHALNARLGEAAGTRPNTIPVTSASPNVNATTRRSTVTVSALGNVGPTSASSSGTEKAAKKS
ncbi:MAG TPA: hypothetical protein VMS30_03310, partial [Phycisphaerales bacterium]|nr:hypothetical protein [Phycisphaerales bacterium]